MDPNRQMAYRVRDIVTGTGLSRTKIYEEMKAGRLRFRQIGKIRIVIAEDFRAWIDALPAGEVKHLAQEAGQS